MRANRVGSYDIKLGTKGLILRKVLPHVHGRNELRSNLTLQPAREKIDPLIKGINDGRIQLRGKGSSWVGSESRRQLRYPETDGLVLRSNLVKWVR